MSEPPSRSSAGSLTNVFEVSKIDTFVSLHYTPTEDFMFKLERHLEVLSFLRDNSC